MDSKYLASCSNLESGGLRRRRRRRRRRRGRRRRDRGERPSSSSSSSAAVAFSVTRSEGTRRRTRRKTTTTPEKGDGATITCFEGARLPEERKGGGKEEKLEGPRTHTSPLDSYQPHFFPRRPPLPPFLAPHATRKGLPQKRAPYVRGEATDGRGRMRRDVGGGARCGTRQWWLGNGLSPAWPEARRPPPPTDSDKRRRGLTASKRSETSEDRLNLSLFSTFSPFAVFLKPPILCLPPPPFFISLSLVITPLPASCLSPFSPPPPSPTFTSLKSPPPPPALQLSKQWREGGT